MENLVGTLDLLAIRDFGAYAPFFATQLHSSRATVEGNGTPRSPWLWLHGRENVIVYTLGDEGEEQCVACARDVHGVAYGGNYIATAEEAPYGGVTVRVHPLNRKYAATVIGKVPSCRALNALNNMVVCLHADDRGTTSVLFVPESFRG